MLRSQSWVDWFAFEGEDAEDAFVDAAEGLVAGEAFEGFDAEGEFAEREGAFVAETAGTQACEVFGRCVFRTVNDAEVFAAAAFDGGLNEAALAFGDEIERFNDHAFAAARR